MGQYSEGSDIREIASEYLKGNGLDLGCGREKILPSAIGVDYVTQGNLKGLPETQADFHGGWHDYFNEHKPKDLDYIFSSHLLEDFDMAYHILDHWIDAVKSGGYIILYLPIEQVFKTHCETTGQPYNPDHKQDWKGYEDFYARLHNDKVNMIDGDDGPGIYSFYIILKKT